MFSAYNSSFDEIVSASIASKRETYYCWVCRKPLILKQGRVIQSHFAHQPRETCNDGWIHPSKTKWHKRMQTLFDTTEVLMEDAESGERHIADAVCRDVVFEFQHSSISAEEVFKRTEFYLEQGYRVVWIVDVSLLFENHKIAEIDKEEHVYSWSRASRMFDSFPLPQACNHVKVVLYWEEYEVATEDYKKRPLTYKRTGYLNHVAWSNGIRYSEIDWDTDGVDCTVRPDLRVFAISKRQSLEKISKLDIESFFNEKSPHTQRCQEIANAYFEEKEDRSHQFANW